MVALGDLTEPWAGQRVGVSTDSSKRECRFYQWETLEEQGSESFSGLAKMRRSANPMQVLHAGASIMGGLLPRLSVTGGLGTGVFFIALLPPPVEAEAMKTFVPSRIHQLSRSR